MNNRTSSGLTLAELLLAAAVLIFALSGLLFLFVACVLSNESSRNLAIATSHAQYVMEGIRNTTPFSSITTDINNGNWDWNSQEVSLAGLVVLPGELIDTSASGTNPLQVDITVSWDYRSKRPSIELHTSMTNY